MLNVRQNVCRILSLWINITLLFFVMRSFTAFNDSLMSFTKKSKILLHLLGLVMITGFGGRDIMITVLNKPFDNQLSLLLNNIGYWTFISASCIILFLFVQKCNQFRVTLLKNDHSKQAHSTYIKRDTKNINLLWYCNNYDIYIKILFLFFLSIFICHMVLNGRYIL